MRHKIQNALDILSSPRSSISLQAGALHTLEDVLAQTLLGEDETSKAARTELFISLQDEFESNISTRLLPWLIAQTECLRTRFEKPCSTADREDGDLEWTVSNIVQSLCVLQGATLLHQRSKEFMGRKLSLQVILDLLSVYRQITHKPLSNSTNSPASRSTRPDAGFVSLASTVLDTLLCILVDASSSMRLFEDANGVEIIVKLLKRASNPKEVRMKCLEFLYFYLMDETGASGPLKQARTQPSSPTKQRSDLLRNNTPFTESASADSTNTSIFLDSTPSFTSATSSTPPQSPTKPRPAPKPRDASAQKGALGMLRKEVDFVPLSPKKAQIAGLGHGKRGGSPSVPPLRLATRQLQRKPSPLSRDTSGDTFFSSDDRAYDSRASAEHIVGDMTISPEAESPTHSPIVRTTEDKKRILGQLLGNVDALVEGVKSAGIWGLGE